MKLGVLLILLAFITDYATSGQRQHVTKHGKWSEAHDSYQHGGRPQTTGIQSHSKFTFSRVSPHHHHSGFRESFQEHYKQTNQESFGSRGHHSSTSFASAQQKGSNVGRYHSVSTPGNQGVHSFGNSNNGQAGLYFGSHTPLSGANHQHHGFRDISHFGMHNTARKSFPKHGHNRHSNSLDYGPHSDYIPREIMRAIKQSSAGFTPSYYHGNEQNFGIDRVFNNHDAYGHNHHSNIDHALRVGQAGVVKNVQNTFDQILRNLN